MARGRALSRLLRWLLYLLLAGVVLSVALVLALRFVDPPMTSFMAQARMAALFSGKSLEMRHEWRDMDHISVHAAVAVVAAEDQLFPLHAGFDLKSIRRALQTNETSARTRGASTITQQVSKNLFLWSGRSWVRKGLEAWFTVLLESLWSKHRILEVYLNVAEFGHGIYGVEAAARTWFGKSAAQLTAADAALLAAVLPSPRRYRVDQPGPYVQKRRAEILRQMHALGGQAWLRDVLSSAKTNRPLPARR